MLLYEERLSRPQRRRVLGLNRYGRKLERIMHALLSGDSDEVDRCSGLMVISVPGLR
jgi:hypothetical protein